MLATRRTATACALCCCLAAGAPARAEERTASIDLTHCYLADVTAIEAVVSDYRVLAYRVQALLMRGSTRANEPGGPLDGAATRCAGTTASVAGAPPVGDGYCEFAFSADDRLLLRWSFEADHGRSVIAGGTGRYWGASGETTFRFAPPIIRSLEPGVIRACTRSTGELRLP